MRTTTVCNQSNPIRNELEQVMPVCYQSRTTEGKQLFYRRYIPGCRSMTVCNPVRRMRVIGWLMLCCMSWISSVLAIVCRWDIPRLCRYLAKQEPGMKSGQMGWKSCQSLPRNGAGVWLVILVLVILCLALGGSQARLYVPCGLVGRYEGTK